ncbi:MAG: primosomal protein N' [Phycisphaerae bacterium]|nr:primosomal protein N' [Phycisphaerae bacterium]
MNSLFPQEPNAGYAQIAVERGIDRYPDGLTYAIPRELADLETGERVVVPLGRGSTPVAGYVVDRVLEPSMDPDNVKWILRRDGSARGLPADLMGVARWVAQYYQAPLGLTVAAMLPSAVRRGVGSVKRRLLDLAPDPPRDIKPTTKQQQVLDALQALPEQERPVELLRLKDMAGIRTSGPVDRLLRDGFLLERRRTEIEAKWRTPPPGEIVPDEPTPAQQNVIDSIGSHLGEGFSTHLLLGVTGSGKTEVYIRLIEQVLQQGRVVLLLVPEIALTPQTGGRLIGRFPEHRVAVLHSALTDAQRHQQWSLAAAGEADIVLGARSAVFAPIPTDRLGLIIVDEEHDSSYKQETTPRYNGRDTAIRRGQLAGCPVLLGSATPSLESWWNATRRGVSQLHRLPERAPGLVVPSVRIVDLVEERRQARRGHQLIGPTLASAITRTLDEDHQVLLLLNRRGWASYVSCSSRSCGWMMNCEHCDVRMVFHRAGELPSGGYLRCHHCNTEVRLPATCPDCGKGVVKLGLGTQRIEAELQERWPALCEGGTLRRVDSDSMRSMQDFHDALGDFASGRIKLLVGTQMIAKGLDVPGVRLVGVIDADTAMHLPDFRAVERTYQLVSQVTGRCGRGSAGGLAVIQTFDPSSPAITMAARNDYDAFAETELADRQQLGLPPATRLARIVIRDRNRDRATEAATRIARQLQDLAEPDITIRGPSTCPIARIADAWREQVEVLAPSASRLQALLTRARERLLLEPASRFQVDVDPRNLL